MPNVGNSLVNRKAATERKNINRHQKRIKVQYFPMTEGVESVSLPLTALHSQEQQQLVACIDRGVDSFSEHGRTARE